MSDLFKPFSRAEFERMWNEGVKVVTIADSMRCSPSTVSHRARRFGLAPRGIGRNHRVTVFGQQHGWPHAWRVRLRPNKNERAGYRIVAYGKTMDEALQALAGLAARIDLAGG